MTDWSEERRELLSDLQSMGGHGRAEGEPLDKFPRGYFPVAEHIRALDPEVVLIVGPRGAGKTELARALTDAGLAEAVARHAPTVRLPTGRTEWKKGYPLDREGFDVGGLRRFLDANMEMGAARDLWLAYLLRAVRNELDQDAQAVLRPLLDLQGGAVRDNHAALVEAGDQPVLALDRLDQNLERANEFLFVTYDELDTLGGDDWSAMEASIQGLVGFWAAYARRWRRIRAKIFLRTDLYDRHATSGGADLAKLASGRVELSWSDRDLHAMLLKRIANGSERLHVYLRRARSAVTWQDDPVLGHVPVLANFKDARPVIERMVGAHMGANKQKGLVYRWLLDHVRDSRGRALPRPFVRLLEEASRIELQSLHPLREPRLLDPSSLRRALDRVSEEHVGHARNEWPWLDAVKAHFKGQLVPWDRDRDVVRLLETPVTGHSRERIPPFEGRDLLDYLIDVGILRRRPDGRIDAPDLFLAGLGLKRKGGVRRR